MIQSIMRLRLFCNHGASTVDPTDSDDAMCTYCGLEVDLCAGSKASTNRLPPACGHLVCVSCAPDVGLIGYGSGCPFCQTSSKAKDLESKSGDDSLECREPAMNMLPWPEELQNSKRYPTKINALLDDIHGGPRNEKRLAQCSQLVLIHQNSSGFNAPLTNKMKMI